MVAPRPWTILGVVAVLAFLVYRTDRILLREGADPLRMAVGQGRSEGGLWHYEMEEEDGVRGRRSTHDLADSLFKAGSRRAAMEAWNVLRLADSTDVRAWKVWGGHRLKMGDLEGALTSLEWAVGLDAGDFELWQSLGVGYARSGRAEEAVSAFDEAVTLRPVSARARLNAGISRLRLEQWADALEQLDSARSSASGTAVAKVEAYRGQALRALGDEEGSEQAYREAVSRDPGQLLARLGLAALESDPAARIEGLERLRNLEPTRGVVHWTLANAYVEAGMTAEAEAAFDRALDLVPDEAQFARDLMRLYLDRDEVDRAQAILNDRFAAAAQSPERLFLEAKVLSGEGDDTGAVLQYDAAIAASGGGMAEAWLNRGAALRRLGRTDEAIASYRRALEVRPGYPGAWYNIGVGLGDAGDHAGAAVAYERCLDLDPGRSRAWYNLAMQRVRLGDEAGALPAFSSAIAVNPTYESAWYNLAVFQRRLGHPDAGASLDSLVNRFPQNEKGWYNRGVFLADAGDAPGAIASYQRAIEVSPTYAAAWNNLAGVLHDEGDREGALTAFREAVQLAPEGAGYRFNLGLQLERMGSWDEAVVQYRRTHQLDPAFFRPIERIIELDAAGHAGGWGLWARDRTYDLDSLASFGADSVYGLGRALHKLGHWAEARQRYADAVALGKEGVWPLYWSAKAAEESGLTSDAVVEYRNVLALRSDFKFALYRLALLLADGAPEESSALWTELEALHPEFAAEKEEEKP